MGIRHPAAAPALRCLPDLVIGIPILREILCFALVTPSARFHEKPPLFIVCQLLLSLPELDFPRSSGYSCYVAGKMVLR
jgi:hypothetical protein